MDNVAIFKLRQTLYYVTSRAVSMVTSWRAAFIKTKTMKKNTKKGEILNKQTLPVVTEETNSSVDNPVFVTDSSSEGPALDKKKQEMTSSSSKDIVECSEDSSSASQPPPYEEIEAEDSKTEEEQKILNVLKDIVKKTTLANPLKRPSARQVVKMLEEVMPRHVLNSMDQFDISDDEDENVTSLESSKKR